MMMMMMTTASADMDDADEPQARSVSNDHGITIDLVDLDTRRPLGTCFTNASYDALEYRTLSRTVSVRPELRFGFLLSLQSQFDWRDGNALEVEITFDRGQRLAQKSVYIVRQKDPSVIEDPALYTLEPNQDGHSCMIDHVWRPVSIEGPYDRACRCTFKFAKLTEDILIDANKPLPASTDFKRHGWIFIKVERKRIVWNQLEAVGTSLRGRRSVSSHRSDSPRPRDSGLFDLADSKLVRAQKRVLLEHGVSVEIELIADTASERDYGGGFRVRECLKRDSTARTRYNFQWEYKEAAFINRIVIQDRLNGGFREPNANRPPSSDTESGMTMTSITTKRRMTEAVKLEGEATRLPHLLKTGRHADQAAATHVLQSSTGRRDSKSLPNQYLQDLVLKLQRLRDEQQQEMHRLEERQATVTHEIVQATNEVVDQERSLQTSREHLAGLEAEKVKLDEEICKLNEARLKVNQFEDTF